MKKSMIKFLCVICVCLVGCFSCKDKANENYSGELKLPTPGASVQDENKEQGGETTENITIDGTEASSKADNGESEKTNEALQQTGNKVTSSDDWKLLLVNPWNTLPEDFDVEMTKISGNHYIDSRAYEDYAEMMKALQDEGLSPLVCSSYRTLQKQTTLYNNQVAKYKSRGYTQASAEAEAGKWVAVPGTSEHHTGLALDIVATSYQVLDESQENTAEQKWLMKNSYKYGFILRYPSDKSDITGIYYEPWHYRYVGKEAAKEIFESGVCLEEYLASVNH